MQSQVFISCFLLGLACAIISVTIIVILPKEKIMNWWFLFGEKYGKEYIDGIECERWFYRPIWGCEKCFAGQLAFWSYLFLHMVGNDPVDWSYHGWFSFLDYNPFFHVFTICVAILSAVFISSLLNKMSNDADN